MSTEPASIISVPTLRCNYEDCGNTWVPRTSRMPKVCPKCKRYDWVTGIAKKRVRKGGKRNVKETSRMGPETQKFLQQREHREEI